MVQACGHVRLSMIQRAPFRARTHRVHVYPPSQEKRGNIMRQRHTASYANGGAASRKGTASAYASA